MGAILPQQPHDRDLQSEPALGLGVGDLTAMCRSTVSDLLGICLHSTAAWLQHAGHIVDAQIPGTVLKGSRISICQPDGSSAHPAQSNAHCASATAQLQAGLACAQQLSA